MSLIFSNLDLDDFVYEVSEKNGFEVDKRFNDDGEPYWIVLSDGCIEDEMPF